MKKLLLLLFILTVLSNLNAKRVEIKFLDMIDTENVAMPVSIFIGPENNQIVIVGDDHRLYWLDSFGDELVRIGKYKGSKPGMFNGPEDLFVDKDANIYVIDTQNSRVQVFNKNNELVKDKCFGKQGRDNGKFNKPVGIWVDKNGDIYISDTGNERIQVFNSEGIFLFTFGKKGKNNGEFDAPFGITVDDDGNIYVADSGNSRIQVFDKSGTFVKKITESSMQDPTDLFYDTVNNLLYVTDNGKHQILIFDKESKLLVKFGTKGDEKGKFNNPTGIVATADGEIYIADMDNMRIQIFSLPFILEERINKEEQERVQKEKEDKERLDKILQNEQDKEKQAELLRKEEERKLQEALKKAEEEKKIKEDEIQREQNLKKKEEMLKQEKERLAKEKKELEEMQKKLEDMKKQEEEEKKRKVDEEQKKLADEQKKENMAKDYLPEIKQKLAIFNFEIIGDQKKLKSIRDTVNYEVKRGLKKSNYFNVSLDEDIKTELKALSLDYKLPISMRNSFIVAQKLSAEVAVTGAVTSYYVEVILTNILTKKEIVSAKMDFEKEADISEAVSKAIENIKLFYFQNRESTVSAPTGLESTAKIGKVELNWEKADGKNIAGYKIYRTDNPDNDMVIIGLSATTTYEDAVPEIDKQFYYKVSTVDIIGHESGKSLLISDAALPQPELKSVATVNVETVNDTIILSWEKSVSKATTGYKIYRSDKKDKGFTDIGQVENLEYTDKDIVAKKMYYYYVTAVNDALESKVSNTVSVKSLFFADLHTFVGSKTYSEAGVWSTTNKKTRKQLGDLIPCDKGNRVIVLDTKTNSKYYKVVTFDGREGWIYYKHFKVK